MSKVDYNHVISNTAKIPVEQIDEGERRREEYGDMGELEDSVAQYGVIQPIAVMDKVLAREEGHDFTDHQPDKRYLLLAGGRRTRAAKKNKHAFIPAIILAYVASDEEVRTIELIENIHRKDLESWERDRLIKEIHEYQVGLKGERTIANDPSTGHSQADTASLLGMSKSKVSQAIRVAKAVEERPELKELKTRRDIEKVLEREEEILLKQRIAALQEEELAKAASGDANPVAVMQQKLIDSYMVGDFFGGVSNVPDGSIDFVEFDPPYAIELVEQKAGDSAAEYAEIARSEYRTFMLDALNECYRVMKSHAWGVCWFGPEPWFEDIYQWLIKAGFTTHRMCLLWIKGSGQTRNPAYNLGNAYEMAFYFRKGTPGIQKQGRTNVFPYPVIAPSKKGHPTAKPIALYEDILQTFCLPASRIMSPCLGSGRIIQAASNLRMTAFGWDLDEGGIYKPEFQSRILAQTPGEYTD